MLKNISHIRATVVLLSYVIVLVQLHFGPLGKQTSFEDERLTGCLPVQKASVQE